MISILGSFQVFTQIYIMTSGGPVNKTTTMVYYMYTWGFKYYDLGYASTLAYGLFALLFGARASSRSRPWCSSRSLR